MKPFSLGGPDGKALHFIGWPFARLDLITFVANVTHKCYSKHIKVSSGHLLYSTIFYRENIDGFDSDPTKSLIQ